MPPESILNSKLFTSTYGLLNSQKYVVIFFVKGSSEESNDAWVLTEADIPEPATADNENIKVFKDIYDANAALQDVLNCLPPAEFFGVVPFAWYADWLVGTGPLKNFGTPARQVQNTVTAPQTLMLQANPNNNVVFIDDIQPVYSSSVKTYNDLREQMEELAKHIEALEKNREV